MSQTIIGRHAEREKLNKILQSTQSEFLALYGRRRVGKTFLIREHLKAQIVFDISGSKESSKMQQLLNFFGEYLYRTSKTKETQVPRSWHEAFQYLADYVLGLPTTSTKHVIFLDEMPWMDTPKSDFISALDFFWNQHISKMDNVLLIACGSAASWIRKHLIKSRGGLYNRVTHRIKLHPFSLHETALFLQSKGIEIPNYQILQLYMIMGGIPFYLKEIEKGKSTTQIIDELCFSHTGLLREEYGQLYHSLFRNASSHIHIIETLASRPQGMTRHELSKTTKINESHLSRALEELSESDFITLFYPFGKEKKEAVYKLTDLYSLFYLKFIHPNLGGGNKVWQQLSLHSNFTAWSGYAFENIYMIHIEQIKLALGISGVLTQHFSWKFKGDDTLPGVQIDMVIDRADQVIHLCEAKFSKDNFVLTKEVAAQWRLKKTVFKEVTKTKKAIFSTLLTTYPAVQNSYYLEEVDCQITLDALFAH